MKRLKKYLAIFLCFVMIVSMTDTAFAVNNIPTSEKVEMYSVKVISNEYDDTYVTFYEVKEKYYLSFNDVKKFTRFELEETDTDIILTQGLREIVIEKSSGNLTDCEYVNQGNIDIVKYNGDYLCEGIPMLMYLGASCTIKEDKALEVMMPDITIWEAIMPDYLDYYVNIADLYGGENNVKICLACDIIADVLDGINGHGLFADANTHIEDALYEILNVDITKYESVKELMADKNQRVNDFLSGEWVSDFLDTGSSATSTVKEIIDYYSNFYFAGEISDSGDLKEASELSKEINQQLYEQAVIKANLDEADNILKTLDIGKIALDTAITSYNLMRYDDDTKNIFSRIINEEVFKYAGYNDISWSNIADKISQNLSSNEAIIQSAACDSVVSYIGDKLTDEGINFVLSELTSKAGIYTSAVQIGTFVASLFNYNRNQAYSAQMNAIWLNIVQYDVAQLTARMLIKERDEYHFTDMASLTRIKNMFTLYYRTLIAFSENLAESIKEFGGNNREIWVQYFSGTSGESVGSYGAEYLYKITNCTVMPIVDYSGLSDELLSAEWLSQFKAANVDIFNILPSEFYFASGVGAWSTEIKLNNDGTFKGQYHDSESGASETGYSDGTVYICNFSGKFTMPKKINEYIYSMNLESLNVEGTPGTVYYENDIRYIVSEPYGFDNADEFLIYLPGCPLEETYEEFLSWSFINTQIRNTIPTGVYGIYNVGGGKGFIGEDDDGLWRKKYTYSYNSYKVELKPSYSSKSHLSFLSQSGVAILSLGFDWSNDSQTEFIASDYRGTGEYNISLDFNEDFSSVMITVKSMSGSNLELWGGTADGILSTEYQAK